MEKEYLTYPKAKYTVAGLFAFTELILDIINLFEYKYGVRLPIETIYGCPNIKWNGGRIVVNDYSSKKNISEELKLVYSNKMTPAITFSNHLISENDLNDYGCRLLLEEAAKYNAIIIVGNDLLKKFIKENYPEIRVQASVIQTALQVNRKELYKTFEKEYYRYVVNVDDNFDYLLLNELNREKAEIMLNEHCKFNCINRKRHYNAIINEQNDLIKGIKKKESFLDENCLFIPEIKQKHIKERTVSLSLLEVKEIYSMGFRNFKIQGRTDNLYSYCFELLHYMVDNDFIIGQTYPIICQIINKFIYRK